MTPEVYKIDIRDICCEDFYAAYFSMSLGRRRKCCGYKRESDKKLCIAADFLLRKALSEKTGATAESLIFSENENGKPFCLNFPLPFSISHAGDFAVVAVGEKNSVGVDIERIRPVKSGILRYFCSNKDLEYIGVQPIKSNIIEDSKLLSKIFRVWTFKEAYAKCMGTGMTEEIKKISLGETECGFQEFGDYCLCVIEHEAGAIPFLSYGDRWRHEKE